MSPTPHKIIQPSAEQIDRHLDNVLTRAGSGLRHYTMHRSLELMRNAMRDALIEAAQAQAAGPELQQIDEPLDGRTHHITDERLKPCPFCNSEPYDARHIEYGRWAVRCRCGASGACANTGPNATDSAKIKAYNDARAAWNARALAAPAPQGEPVSAALSDIVALWDLDAPLRYNEALHMQAKRALAGEQPVSPDLNRWCVYVAGMISGWLEIARPQIMSMGDEARTQAIAGIIERRLWAMPKDTAPAPAVPSDVLSEMREFGKAKMAEFMGAHHMALVLSQKIKEWADKLTAAPTPPAQPKCLTCNGHGLIGGHMQDGSGYGEGCPDCNPEPAVPESADGGQPAQTSCEPRCTTCGATLDKQHHSMCGAVTAAILGLNSARRRLRSGNNAGASEVVERVRAVLSTASPAVPESADGAMPVQLGELAKRNVYDAIRGAYDLGYNDARNARAVPGDSAPGYDGRNVEADHGGALLNSLHQRLRNAAAQPAAPDDVARAGAALANIAFNLAQCAGQTIDAGMCLSMDAASAAEKGGA